LLLLCSGEIPRGEKPFYASKPSLKQSMMQTTCTSSRLAKASKLGKNLSAVPAASTLKSTLATVEGAVEEGAQVMVAGAVQTAGVIPNVAPKVASAPKEPEDTLLSNVEKGAKVVAPECKLLLSFPTMHQWWPLPRRNQKMVYCQRLYLPLCLFPLVKEMSRSHHRVMMIVAIVTVRIVIVLVLVIAVALQVLVLM
jgi:hypothetical protein